jgi:hypothetical protein
MTRDFQTRCIWILFSLAVAAVPDASGTTSQGGVGLVYVNAAKTLPKGYMTFFSGVRYYGKVANFGLSEVAYTFWDVQGHVSLNYAVSRNVEFALSPILYQDTQGQGGNILHGKANFPDDLFLSVKAGSYSALESPFMFGGMATLRIPTADGHNVIYEPYSAGSVEVWLTALGSYYRNLAFPDMGWSIHANLGYLNHNDVSKKLARSDQAPRPNQMSSELLVGAGFLYPAGTFDFSAEINARYFLTRPPSTAFSREYVSYLTLGVYYRPYRWLTVQASLDKSLVVDRDNTEYTYLPERVPDFPNYPGWRAGLGATLAVLPFSLYQSDEADIRQKARDRQDILEKMIENQSDMQSAEQELSRIQAERKKVEEELERLRKLLESEQDKKDGGQP